MTFDDEEHRVKRILDTDPTTTQNEIHATDSTADSGSAIGSDSASSQDSHEVPVFDGEISKQLLSESLTEDATEDATEDLTGASAKDSGENAVKNATESSEDSFYTNNEEVYKSPAQQLQEEEEHRKNKPKATHMGVLDHLGELRRRLTRIVIFILIGFFGFYGVSELAYSYLALPLTSQLPEGSKLIYTSPQGAFFTYLKVSFMLSILGTSPLTFYQIWAFIAPGLYKEEQKAIMPLAFLSALFFISGAAFCYFLVFPIAFHFFLGFTSDMVIPMISVEEYLSFALKLVIAFGLVFEMPLFSYFLAKLGLITPEAMKRQRKYAILVIFITAAVLTPPDVFSQTLMALPMLFLYEVSIYVAKVARGLNEKNSTEDDIAEDEEEQNLDNAQDMSEETNTNMTGNVKSTSNTTKAKPSEKSMFSSAQEEDLSLLSDEELAQRINNLK